MHNKEIGAGGGAAHCGGSEKAKSDCRGTCRNYLDSRGAPLVKAAPEQDERVQGAGGLKKEYSYGPVFLFALPLLIPPENFAVRFFHLVGSFCFILGAVSIVGSLMVWFAARREGRAIPLLDPYHPVGWPFSFGLVLLGAAGIAFGLRLVVKILVD
jgi:hypothetical protein